MHKFLYRGSKYGNKKTMAGGKLFDSGKEARRYSELRLLEKSGKISGLKNQVRFLLQPSFVSAGVTHRKIEYVADFVYLDSMGDMIVEDTKGFKTELYKLKKKLLLYKFKDIHFIES